MIHCVNPIYFGTTQGLFFVFYLELKTLYTITNPISTSKYNLKRHNIVNTSLKLRLHSQFVSCEHTLTGAGNRITLRQKEGKIAEETVQSTQ